MLELPHDVLTCVVAFMDVSSFAALTATCKTMYTLQESVIVWRIIYDNLLSCQENELAQKLITHHSYLSAYKKINRKKSKYISHKAKVIKDQVRQTVSQQYIQRYSPRLEYKLHLAGIEQLEEILAQVERTIEVHVPKHKQHTAKRTYIYRLVLKRLEFLLRSLPTPQPIIDRLFIRIFVHNQIDVPRNLTRHLIKREQIMPLLNYSQFDLRWAVVTDYTDDLQTLIDYNLITPIELQRQLKNYITQRLIRYYVPSLQKIQAIEKIIGRINLTFARDQHYIACDYLLEDVQGIEWMVSSPGMDYEGMGFILCRYTALYGYTNNYKEFTKCITGREDFDQVWKFINLEELLLFPEVVDFFIGEMKMPLPHEVMTRNITTSYRCNVLQSLEKYCNFKGTIEYND
jgi:hypothetical protein